MTGVAEGIAIGILANLLTDMIKISSAKLKKQFLIEESRFPSELLDAFEKALKKSGVKNKSIRERYLNHAYNYFDKLIPKSPDQRLADEYSLPNIFIEKLLRNFEYEIIENELLYRWVQYEYSKQDLDISQKLLDKIEYIAKPENLVKLFDLLEFPHQHPNRIDFETGVYYRNDSLYQDVWQNLSTYRRCLIVGKPGSGKTALARGMGYEFEQDHPENIVFYNDVKKNPYAGKWLKEMEQYDNPHTLFIIDNCHVAADSINDFISQWHRLHQAKFLLLSRQVNPELIGTSDESYLDVLEAETVSLNINKEILQKIIQNLVNRTEIANRKIGDVDQVLDKCTGDLHVLNYYVDAWLKNPDTSISLSAIDEESILDNIYRHYIVNNQNSSLELRIAALSQFEIKVEVNWFDEVERNKLQDIQRTGTIETSYEKILGRNLCFIQYFHSTPATYLIKAASRKDELNRKSLDQYIFYQLKTYLSYKPANFFEVFFQLHINDLDDLQAKLFEQTEAIAWLRELLGERKDHLLVDESIFIGFVRFLSAVSHWDFTQAKELFEYIRSLINLQAWSNFMISASLRSLNFLRLLIIFDNVFILQLFNSLDVKTLGESTNNAQVGITTIRNFLELTGKVKVRPSDILGFCTSLDFKVLGERTKNAQVGLNSVVNFLRLTWQVGVKTSDIQDFCTALDFKALGERAKSAQVGLATVMHFLQLTRQAGVKLSDKQEFCTALDFKALGERAKSAQIGLATVRMFLQLTMQAGVKVSDIQAFCFALDFKALGERAKRSQAGLSNVHKFLQLIRQGGVKVSDTQDFCSSLDWKELGRLALDKDMKLRISPLHLFHELIQCEGINDKFALEFIEGIGWENLRDCMKRDFNPDGLAALRKFLTHKCKYDAKELKQKGLEWRSKTTWFRAFINKPRSTTDENVHLYGQYLKYARNGLLYEDISLLLKSDEMDLCAWNIFIHNMKLADPNYIQRTIVPILSHYSVKQIENLFIQSDLKNIGFFFDHFNHQDGVFHWNLPSNIDYQKIDFINLAQQSSLTEIAYFIFNFGSYPNVGKDLNI